MLNLKLSEKHLEAIRNQEDERLLNTIKIVVAENNDGEIVKEEKEFVVVSSKDEITTEGFYIVK